jgi:hypothetical protein
VKTKITILTFCMLLGSNGLAQVKHGPQAATTGNALLDCLNIETPLPPGTPIQTLADSMFCQGYVLGVFHAISIKDHNGLGIDGVNPPLVCLRPGVTGLQIKDIIRNYLYAHPESRDKNSSRLILAAMQEAFPCSNTPAPPGTPAPPNTPGPTK